MVLRQKRRGLTFLKIIVVAECRLDWGVGNEVEVGAWAEDAERATIWGL